MLWTYVHLNVRDYLDVRAKGMVALRTVMQPTKAALRKDVRKRKVSIQQVRDLGLRDLLVEAFGPQ